VSGAFHSSLMRPAAQKFESELKKVHFHTPKFSLLSNVDAAPTKDTELIRKNLGLQITSSVQWVDSIQNIVKEGVTHFIEIGPGNVLKGLIRKINKDLVVYNIAKPEDLEKLPF